MSCCFDRNHPPDPASPEALWGNARGCWQAFVLLFGDALSLLGEVFIRRDQRNQANAFLRGLEALVRRLLLIEAIRTTGRTPVAPNGITGAQGARPANRQPGQPPSPVIPGREANPGPGDGQTPYADTLPVPTSCETGQRDSPAGGRPPHPAPSRESGDPAELDTETTDDWPAHFPLRLNTLLGANLPEPRDVTRASHWPRKRRPSLLDLPPHAGDEPGLPVFDFAASLALRLEALRRVIVDPAPYVRRAACALARFRAGNQPPRLIGPPDIPGDNNRFLLHPLARIDRTASEALGRIWPDTS